RQKAQRTLTAAGRPALVYLKAALHDRDPEIARRAAWAVEVIERVPYSSVMTAVARRLAARRPPRTVEALLAYLPSVTEDTVEEAILQALLAVGGDEGKLHAALKAALTDREPSRRAAAAFVYGRAKPPQTEPLLPLLRDADATVRLRAAEGLVL